MSADLDGCMVAIVPPDGIIEELAEIGDEPADNIHLTVIYPGSADEVDIDLLKQCVQEVSARHDPLPAEISGYGVFHNEESYVLHATVNLPGLDALKVDLAETLEDAGIDIPDKYGLDPHITLLYSDSLILEVPAEVPENGWEVTELIVFDAGDRTTFSLGGKSASVSLPEGEYKYRVLIDCPDRCVTWDRVVTHNDLYGDGGPEMAIEDLCRTSAAELLALSTESDTSAAIILEIEGEQVPLGDYPWLSDVDPELLAEDIWGGLSDALGALGFKAAGVGETTYNFLISHTRRGDAVHVRGCSYLLARDVYRNIQIQASDPATATTLLDPELRLCGHCMGGVL